MYLSTTSLATLALLVVAPLYGGVVQGCAGYLHCHCYDNTGVPNDTATETACNRYKDTDAGMIDANAWSDGARECRYNGPTSYTNLGSYTEYYYAFSNCDWKGLCKDAGATGQAASCRDKPPLGKGSSKHVTIVAIEA